MRDVTGREVNIGDVVAGNFRGKQFCLGIVKGFTDKTIQIYTKSPFLGNHQRLRDHSRYTYDLYDPNIDSSSRYRQPSAKEQRKLTSLWEKYGSDITVEQFYEDNLLDSYWSYFDTTSDVWHDGVVVERHLPNDAYWIQMARDKC